MAFSIVPFSTHHPQRPISSSQSSLISKTIFVWTVTLYHWSTRTRLQTNGGECYLDDSAYEYDQISAVDEIKKEKLDVGLS